MPFFATAAPIIGSVVEGLFSRKNTKAQNQAQIASAREQMAFQERMSSTAHQREVEDLRKAGLNPILSATGGAGASAPGGAQASIEAPDVPDLGQAVSSALQARVVRQQFQNLKAEERKIESEADAADANARILNFQSRYTDQLQKAALSEILARTENLGVNSARTALESTIREKDVPLSSLKLGGWKDAASLVEGLLQWLGVSGASGVREALKELERGDSKK